MAPTLSRVNSHAFVFKALFHCATPVKSTKCERVDGNSTGLFGTQRGTKHIGRQTQWQTPTCTFGGRDKLDPSMVVDMDCCAAANNRACSMSVDVTMPDCSSKAARKADNFHKISSFARVLVRAPVDGPGSQSTRHKGPHPVWSVLSMPTLAV